jgi:hypothetical protein
MSRTTNRTRLALLERLRELEANSVPLVESRDWQELKAAILDALVPFPDALAAVEAAIAAKADSRRR